jgi:hypothetical protein
MVVALLALIAALGGSAFAAGYVVTRSSQIKDGAVTGADVKNASLTGSDAKDSSLTGSDVKNASLTGSDIRDRSLGGADIDVSKLGKVPAATTADGATTAGTASVAERARISDEVDGQHVERVADKLAPGTSARVVGADGGLLILAGCSDAGELLLQAGSTTSHALVRASVISAFSGPADVAVVEDADLNPGEHLTLFDAHGRGTAHVAYLDPDGRVSTALIGFGEFTGTQTCTVTGTLIRAG